MYRQNHYSNSSDLCCLLTHARRWLIYNKLIGTTLSGDYAMDCSTFCVMVKRASRACGCRGQEVELVPPPPCPPKRCSDARVLGLHIPGETTNQDTYWLSLTHKHTHSRFCFRKQKQYLHSQPTPHSTLSWVHSPRFQCRPMLKMNLVRKSVWN